MKFKPLGAVDGSVTGSCTYFQYDKTNTKFLVDCGLVQGEPHAPATNAAKFPFNPSELKFVLLTHAHLDHCGLIPRLYKEGFSGQVLCTEATAKLAKISLLDAAKYCGNLYSKDDVNDINFFHVDKRSDFGFYRFIPIDDELFACFTRSAHILGSVSISLSWKTDSGENRVITMSGDIGNNTKENPYQSLLAHKQIPPINSNYILCESTYGERERDSHFKSHENRLTAIQDIVERESFRDGKLLVFPAFSIHRTQEIMLDIAQVLSGPGKHSFGLVQERPLPQGLAENVRKNEWHRGDQNHIERVLSAPGVDKYDVWADQIEQVSISKNNKKAKPRFRLKDPDKAEQLLAQVAAAKLPEFRSIHVESGMAAKVNKVYASQLNKRQRYKSNELLERNRRLTSYFDKPTEEDIDQVITTIFDEDEKDRKALLGAHSISTGIKPSYLDHRERYSKIILTGGGMCDGGPITGQLEAILPSERVCIVLSGFMAKGTAGAALKAIHDKRQHKDKGEEVEEGEITVHLPNGKNIRESDVKATIIDLSAYYSGHADQGDLVDHLMNTGESKHTDMVAKDVTVFINHGTQKSRETLKQKLLEYEGKQRRDVKTVLLPEKHDTLFDLNAGTYTDEDIEIPAHENGELTAIHSELAAIRKLLERLVSKQG